MFDLFAPSHLLIILLIAFFVFGPKKLPDLGAGLGKGIREFKKAMSEIDQDTKRLADEGKRPEPDPSNRA